jgi:hypothetical protein
MEERKAGRQRWAATLRASGDFDDAKRWLRNDPSRR